MYMYVYTVLAGSDAWGQELPVGSSGVGQIDNDNDNDNDNSFKSYKCTLNEKRESTSFTQGQQPRRYTEGERHERSS